MGMTNNRQQSTLEKSKFKVFTIEIYAGGGLKIQYMSHSPLAQGAPGHMSLHRQLPAII